MKTENVGKIISVSDLNVKILLNSNDVGIKDILYYKENKDLHRFEIVQIDENTAIAIPLESVHGVKKGIELALLERRFTSRVF